MRCVSARTEQKEKMLAVLRDMGAGLKSFINCFIVVQSLPFVDFPDDFLLYLTVRLVFTFSSSSSDAWPESESSVCAFFISFIKSSIENGA